MPEPTIQYLERMSKEHGHPLMCAKRKDGSWILYIAPGAKDVMGLMLRATLEIESHNQPK